MCTKKKKTKIKKEVIKERKLKKMLSWNARVIFSKSASCGRGNHLLLVNDSFVMVTMLGLSEIRAKNNG